MWSGASYIGKCEIVLNRLPPTGFGRQTFLNNSEQNIYPDPQKRWPKIETKSALHKNHRGSSGQRPYIVNYQPSILSYKLGSNTYSPTGLLLSESSTGGEDCWSSWLCQSLSKDENLPLQIPHLQTHKIDEHQVKTIKLPSQFDQP